MKNLGLDEMIMTLPPDFLNSLSMLSISLFGGNKVRNGIRSPKHHQGNFKPRVLKVNVLSKSSPRISISESILNFYPSLERMF